MRHIGWHPNFHDRLFKERACRCWPILQWLLLMT